MRQLARRRRPKRVSPLRQWCCLDEALGSDSHRLGRPPYRTRQGADPTPEKLDRTPPYEFEQKDLEAAEGASDGGARCESYACREKRLVGGRVEDDLDDLAVANGDDLAVRGRLFARLGRHVCLDHRDVAVGRFRVARAAGADAAGDGSLQEDERLAAVVAGAVGVGFLGGVPPDLLVQRCGGRVQIAGGERLSSAV